MSLLRRRPPTTVVLQHVDNREQEMKAPIVKKSYMARSSPRSVLDQKMIVEQKQVSTDATATRKTQRRLALLHHASICNRENCHEFAYCQALKRLHSHILTCDGRQCLVPGCKKNRQAWKHYQSCKDIGACVICSSVAHA